MHKIISHSAVKELFKEHNSKIPKPEELERIDAAICGIIVEMAKMANVRRARRTDSILYKERPSRRKRQEEMPGIETNAQEKEEDVSERPELHSDTSATPEKENVLEAQPEQEPNQDAIVANKMCANCQYKVMSGADMFCRCDKSLYHRKAVDATGCCEQWTEAV